VEVGIAFLGLLVNARAARESAEAFPRTGGGIVVGEAFVAIAAAADATAELQAARRGAHKAGIRDPLQFLARFEPAGDGPKKVRAPVELLRTQCHTRTRHAIMQRMPMMIERQMD